MVMDTPENKEDKSSDDESSTEINHIPSSIVVDALNALRRFRKYPTQLNKKHYEDTRNDVIQAESSSDN